MEHRALEADRGLSGMDCRDEERVVSVTETTLKPGRATSYGALGQGG
jgi:hypothetical protein